MNIMQPLTLNASDNKQVASAKKLEMLVGTPPNRLLIFTGIAMPVLQSNGQLDGQEVTVNLNAKSNEPNPQFTATVGLASIYNKDSDLIFATDDVKVITDENLELLLVCNIAVMGDSSVLQRFSYQATVLLHVDNGSVIGNIRWSPHFLVFLADHDLFDIVAFTINAGSGSPDGFGTVTPKVEKVGVTVGTVVRQGHWMGIPYEIHDLPLGVALFVSVVPKPGAFLILNTTDATFNFVQVAGPSVITLNAGHLTETPVDFEARPFFRPR